MSVAVALHKLDLAYAHTPSAHTDLPTQIRNDVRRASFAPSRDFHRSKRHAAFVQLLRRNAQGPKGTGNDVSPDPVGGLHSLFLG